ncbi:hypothetical protein FKM82_003977 [Ascaphus truei]|uniref:C-C motif chemokine 20-like n=1 Tax=Ascaphus truei TaxID=8439 RepID=UPI003F59CEAC
MSYINNLAVLCILALGLLYFTNAAQAGVYDCCYTYSKKPLPVRLIKGFTMQNSYEVCDIDAIIFITKKFRVCANPKEQWVINTVKMLRTRRNKNLEKYLMENSGPSAN